ncbi:MAG: AAA family ATPase [Thermoplasmata archaeon]
MIVLLVGMPGSGKDEFIKKARELGIEVISMGDIVRDYTLSLGMELSNSNVGTVANEERKKNGMDIWAKRTLEKIKSERCVIDGIRNKEEIEYFKNNFKEKITVVAILSSQQTRFKRIMVRSRKDDAKNWNEFVEREKRELSWGLGNVIALADYYIINEGTLDEFRSRVENFLKGLKDC